MRNFSLLSTAIAISILAAALGASCALPPYLHETSGGTASGSGGAGGAVASSVTSSGQGGASGPSTSSGGSPGASSGSAGGGTQGDGGPVMCTSPLTTCLDTDHAGGPCGCPKSICMNTLCKDDMDADQVEGLFCKGGSWIALKANLGCCPDAADCDAGKICQVAVVIDPTAMPVNIASQCIAPGPNCKPGQKLTCDCFLPGDPCSQFPGTHCSIHPLHDVVICTP